jgi:arylsulfatase A-like enzyme
MPKFTRRDFLKLLGSSPLLFAPKVANLPTRLPYRMPAGSSQTTPPNILILVFDSLSARNMSLYGYPRQNTPHLERFAKKAIVYHRHYAAANFTTPGTASLLTGVYPWRHRAIRGHGQVVETYATRNLLSLLPEYYRFAYTHNPLAYILLRQAREHIDQLMRISDLCLFSDTPADSWFNRDYTIAYYSELLAFRNGLNPSGSLFLSHLDRMRRIFGQNILNRTHHEDFPRGLPSHYDVLLPSFLVFTLEQVIDWLDTQVRNAPQPFVGYIHMLPPHTPYVTRREFADRFVDEWKPPSKPLHHFQEGHTEQDLNVARRYYDEDIAYVDAEFGRLYDLLETSGAMDNTLLIVTSDHGEMFERGIFTHVTPTLYEPLLHIPLIISRPGITERQDILEPTSAVDIFPTLLSLTGQTIPEWCEGRTLPSFPGALQEPGRSIFAVEAKENAQYTPLQKVSLAMVKGRYKLVYYLGYEDFSDIYEMYDLQDDPEELSDIYPTSPLAPKLRAELQSKLSDVNAVMR